MEPLELTALARQIRDTIARVIVGHEHVVDELIVALLCEGHILLEGPPGTAKTLLANTFARSCDLGFRRIQFTPDLMPADVIGTNLFNFETNRFALVHGPVFTDILLADEINRAPPKTQSALLQAMQERTVTIDGVNHGLSTEFMVVATENPIEQEGTYPLPEAQLDRFLFKVVLGYPSREDELGIVRLHGRGTAMPRLDRFGIETVVTRQALQEARAFVAGLGVAEEIVAYVVDLVRATRQHPSILHGGSPRASTVIASCSRARAALMGRSYVIPDDIKALFVPALRHRIVLAPSAEIEGTTADDVLREILESAEAPR